MDISLNAIASMVLNDVFGGLKAKTDIPLTIKQVKDEIVAMRGDIIRTDYLTGKLNNLQGLYQTIPCLQLNCQDFAQCCNVDLDINALGVQIPKLFDLFIPDKRAVLYFGTPDMRQPFNVLTGNDYLYLSKQRFVANKPAVWFDYKGYAWVFNPPTAELEYITMTAIFDDPRSIYDIICCGQSEDSAFPVPSWMVERITSKLTNDYIRYFRQGDPQPNTMSPLENGPQPRIQ